MRNIPTAPELSEKRKFFGGSRKNYELVTEIGKYLARGEFFILSHARVVVLGRKMSFSGIKKTSLLGCFSGENLPFQDEEDRGIRTVAQGLHDNADISVCQRELMHNGWFYFRVGPLLGLGTPGSSDILKVPLGLDSEFRGKMSDFIDAYKEARKRDPVHTDTQQYTNLKGCQKIATLVERSPEIGTSRHVSYAGTTPEESGKKPLHVGMPYEMNAASAMSYGSGIKVAEFSNSRHGAPTN